MCPVTMAIVGGTLLAGGAYMQYDASNKAAKAQMKQAKAQALAQAQALEYNAKVLENNALRLNYRKEAAKSASARSKAIMYTRLQAAKGNAANQYAAGGVLLGSGSANAYMEDALATTMEDYDTESDNLKMKLWDIGNQQDDLRSKVTLMNNQALNTRYAGDYASEIYKMQKQANTAKFIGDLGNAAMGGMSIYNGLGGAGAAGGMSAGGGSSGGFFGGSGWSAGAGSGTSMGMSPSGSWGF